MGYIAGVLYTLGAVAVHNHGSDMGWEDGYGMRHDSPGAFGWFIVLLWPLAVLWSMLDEMLFGRED